MNGSCGGSSCDLAKFKFATSVFVCRIGEHRLSMCAPADTRVVQGHKILPLSSSAAAAAKVDVLRPWFVDSEVVTTGHSVGKHALGAYHVQYVCSRKSTDKNNARWGQVGAPHSLSILL